MRKILVQFVFKKLRFVVKSKSEILVVFRSIRKRKIEQLEVDVIDSEI